MSESITDRILSIRRLFYREWWVYVLDDSRADSDYGNYVTRCWCRANGHPCGVVWYSHGLEPDMTCNGCGEDLG